MTIDLTEAERDRLFKSYFQVMELREAGEISNIAAATVIVRISMLVAEDDRTALRKILFHTGAIDMLIFRLTKMPAPRTR